MMPVFPEHLHYELARQRHEELLRESVRERHGRESAALPAGLRWKLGEILMAVGRRLQAKELPLRASRR